MSNNPPIDRPFADAPDQVVAFLAETSGLTPRQVREMSAGEALAEAERLQLRARTARRAVH